MTPRKWMDAMTNEYSLWAAMAMAAAEASFAGTPEKTEAASRMSANWAEMVEFSETAE